MACRVFLQRSYPNENTEFINKLINKARPTASAHLSVVCLGRKSRSEGISTELQNMLRQSCDYPLKYDNQLIIFRIVFSDSLSIVAACHPAGTYLADSHAL